MVPSSPGITGSPSNSASIPTSATPEALGKKAASKTPSDDSGVPSRAKQTSIPSPTTPSTSSSQNTTIPPGNASASKPQPKPSSNRCTSNVNPHPDQVRDDEKGGGRNSGRNCSASERQ